MLPLRVRRLRLDGDEVVSDDHGDLLATVREHLTGDGPGGLVVLGSFGSGKTSFCRALHGMQPDGGRPATFVPLAVVARAPTVEAGLRRAAGADALDEARVGERVLLLDGLDEVPPPNGQTHSAWFEALIDQVGPRWILTSRPSHVRTDVVADPDQADTLERPDVVTVEIAPLDPHTVADVVGQLPRGDQLLRTVEGLHELATTPLLLHVVEAALPHIQEGRPIDAWGLFDAWLRYSLRTGSGHDDALARLEAAAWEAFRHGGFHTETMSLDADVVRGLKLPFELERTLLVTELDGRYRFGHRSLFEFLLAAHMAPRLLANQGQGPDALSGLHLTDATRAFLVGRVGRMPVQRDGDRVRIPRGNFVAGGSVASDERRLRIAHLPHDVWIARAPVTGAQWAAYLRDAPDDRQDANYLPHWGPSRTLPRGHDDLPVYGVWPSDADAYARWAGAELPTADTWEKAVRGLDGRTWPWGEHWRRGHAVTAELGVNRPLAVRAFGAHGDAQLFSAVGGVFEITASDYRDRPDRGRVVMGGCFTHPHRTARPSLRLSHTLSGRLKTGLRLAWRA